jgi:hypothetical protein
MGSPASPVGCQMPPGAPKGRFGIFREGRKIILADAPKSASLLTRPAASDSSGGIGTRNVPVDFNPKIASGAGRTRNRMTSYSQLVNYPTNQKTDDMMTHKKKANM